MELVGLQFGTWFLQRTAQSMRTMQPRAELKIAILESMAGGCYVVARDTRANTPYLYKLQIAIHCLSLISNKTNPPK